MKKAFLAIMVLTTIICVAQIAQALQFSADMVSASKEGSLRGKIYVSDNKSRVDMPGVGATITSLDQKKVWVVMDRERMYMEQRFDPKNAATVREKAEGEVERKLLGNETIDGRSAKKYHVVAESPGERIEMYQWVDATTGIPLKTSAVNGDWSVEYKNLKTGVQDPALFEIPAGYKKFAVPTMDDMKAMMRDAGAGE